MSVKSFLNSHRNFIQEHKVTFVKFCLVGGASTILNYSVFFVFYQFFDVFYLISSGTGYISGVIFGFYFNKIFTFESESDKYYQEGIMYFALYSVSLFLGLALLRGLVFVGIPVLLANVIVIGFTTVTNYLGSKYVVFASTDWYDIVEYYRYKYRHLLLYIAIGLGSLVVEIVAIAGFSSISFRWPNIVVGFLFGVVFSYVLNAWYNFTAPENRSVRTFEIFAVISTFAFLLNIFLIQYVFPEIGQLLSNQIGQAAILHQFIQEYTISRFVSAATVFLISYSLHIRYTFTTKKVGLAVYLSESEDVHEIRSTVDIKPDFIHLDLVDETYNENAEPVDLDVLDDVNEAYPDTIRMAHIMSEHPLRWMKALYQDVDTLIFHPEGDIDELIAFCREHGVEAGLCITHDTQIRMIQDYLEDIDVVQVLGIEEPGVSGQGMAPQSLDTVERLQELRWNGYGFDVCFDGGVKRSNVHKIDAEYIVSASAVLKASDPKRALYDLKTNARHYSEMTEDFKKHLKKGIDSALSSLEFVKSGTLVGSFTEDTTIERISDVDIVVIVDELTEAKYETVVKEFEALADQIEVDYGYDVRLNTTFGPLKFNEEGNLVLHVMIYDEDRHKYHCRRSPFTCLAWQISDTYFKQPMTAIAKVPTLQPNHFFEKRRSISDYVEDLRSETISYREYEFDETGYNMVEREKETTDKDRFEFAYHIMKFSITNFLKLYTQSNEHYDLEETMDRYFSVFPDRADQHRTFLLELQEMKFENDFPTWEKDHENAIRRFLEDFEHQFREYFEDATSIYLLRHAETPANGEGTFLGQGRNPGIEDATVPNLPDDVGRLYSSPLKRACETAAVLKEQLGLTELTVDDRLAEIDYGEAEGLTYEELEQEYPELISAWDDQKDPAFPGGENTYDVKERIEAFLAGIEYGDEDTAVVTHNVVLRCILGSEYDVPMHQWHEIVVPHAEPIELLIAENGNRYINLTEDQVQTCFQRVEFKDER